MSLGYFEEQEMNAPGAWDHLEHADPTNPGPATGNAAHRKYNQALAVQERAASQVIFSYCELDAGVAPQTQGDAIQVVGRQRGRKWVMLKVPTAATQSVYISHRGEEINQFNSWLMAPGDQPLYLRTEGSIWAASAGTTAAALNVAVGVATDSDLDQ